MNHSIKDIKEELANRRKDLERIKTETKKTEKIISDLENIVELLEKINEKHPN